MNKTYLITDLISLKTLQKIQDNFAEATGIGCIIRDLNGEAVTKYSKLSRMWSEITKNPQIEQEQKQNLLKAIKKCLKTGQVEVFQRYIDTYTFISPININGRILAFMFGGLTRFGNPNMDICTMEANKLNIELDKFLEMYLELPFITKTRLQACGDLFKNVTGTFSSLAKEIEIASSELKQSEEQYKQLFYNIKDGVCFTDNEGYLKDINPAGAKILGYKPEDIISKPFKNVYANPDDREEFIKVLLQKGHIENYKLKVRTKQGKIKFLETSSIVVKDKNGKTIGFQGIFRDIASRAEFMERYHLNLKENAPSSTFVTDIKNH